MEHLLHGFADEGRGVVDDGVIEPFGEALFQPPHRGPDVVGHVQGVGPGQLVDRQAGRRLAVHGQAAVLILGPQLDAGHVLEIGDLGVRAGFENDVGELFGFDQPAEGVHGELEVLALRHRRLADLPCRHLHVLLAEDADHVAGHQVPRLQLVRVEPDPHAVVLPAERENVAHALQPGQRILEMDGSVIGQVKLVVIRPAGFGIGVGIQIDDQEDIRRPLLDGHADGPDQVGQRRLRDGDAVLHQHLGHVRRRCPARRSRRGCTSRRCCFATTCTACSRRR